MGIEITKGQRSTEDRHARQNLEIGMWGKAHARSVPVLWQTHVQQSGGGMCNVTTHTGSCQLPHAYQH